MLAISVALLIHADDTARFLLRRSLQRVAQVQQVVGVSTCEAALRLLPKLAAACGHEEPMLIVLDTHLQPDIGRLFLRERARLRLAPHALVVCTHFDDVSGARAPGVTAYLSKPVSDEALVNVLRPFFPQVSDDA